MKNIVIITLILISNLNCFSQEDKYNKVLKKNTLEGYEKFLNKYPESIYANEIKGEYLFKCCTVRKLTPKCIEYMKLYPDGKYVQLALNSMERDVSNRAMNNNNEEDFNNYLNYYPNGKNYTLIDSLREMFYHKSIIEKNIYNPLKIDFIDIKEANELIAKYYNLYENGKYKEDLEMINLYLDFCQKKSIENATNYLNNYSYQQTEYSSVSFGKIIVQYLWNEGNELEKLFVREKIKTYLENLSIQKSNISIISQEFPGDNIDFLTNFLPEVPNKLNTITGANLYTIIEYTSNEIASKKIPYLNLLSILGKIGNTENYFEMFENIDIKITDSEKNNNIILLHFVNIDHKFEILAGTPKKAVTEVSTYCKIKVINSEKLEVICNETFLAKGSFSNYIYSLGSGIEYANTSEALDSLSKSISRELINYSNNKKKNLIISQEESILLNLSKKDRGNPCPGIETISWQGQIYNTVLIGYQCWMKENLNIGTMINLDPWGWANGDETPTDNGIIEKYCIDNIEDNCEAFGGLYRWDEMMQYSAQEGIQGICPPNWHIPSDEEWKILEGTVDGFVTLGSTIWDENRWRGVDVGVKLKSENGWGNTGNGNNEFGFSALPTAYSDALDYYTTLWWTSSLSKHSQPLRRILSSFSTNNRQIKREGSLEKDRSYVRCIKDY